MDTLSKKTLTNLGSVMNEHAASKPSDWARKMLMKQGWSEGQGLGKNASGMKSHIKVEQKKDTRALGYKPDQHSWADQWWLSSFDYGSATAGKIGGKAAVSMDSGDDSDSDSDSSVISDSSDSSVSSDEDSRKRNRDSSDAEPIGDVVDKYQSNPNFIQDYYAKLFKATGGARLGMRARRAQPGKWERAELKITSETGEEPSDPQTCASSDSDSDSGKIVKSADEKKSDAAPLKRDKEKDTKRSKKEKSGKEKKASEKEKKEKKGEKDKKVKSELKKDKKKEKTKKEEKEAKLKERKSKE